MKFISKRPWVSSPGVAATMASERVLSCFNRLREWEFLNKTTWWRSWESELESLLSNRERWERKSEWIRLESATRFGYFYHLVMFLVTFFHQKCSQNPYFFLACGGLGGRLKWVFGFYLDPLGGRLKWVVDLSGWVLYWSSPLPAKIGLEIMEGW